MYIIMNNIIYSTYCITNSIHIVSSHKRLSLKLLQKSFLLLRNIQEVHTKGFQECPIKKTKSITLQWFNDEEHLFIKIQFRKCGRFFLLFIVDISALVQIFLILFISEGENLVESLLIFCKRPNCIKDILLRSYRPNTATQADNKSFVKSQRLAEALKPVSFLSFFFLFCYPLCCRRRVSAKPEASNIEISKRNPKLLTVRYERSHLAEFSHQQLSQPTVADINKIC